MSRENQTEIKVVTYKEERLNYFTALYEKAKNKFDRLFKKHKDAPYLSDEFQKMSNAGHEAEFLGDVVKMLKQSEWISVDERLPETTDKILVYCSNGEIFLAKYIRAQGLEFWFEETYRCHNITHWMPLPEAPKMKGGEE